MPIIMDVFNEGGNYEKWPRKARAIFPNKIGANLLKIISILVTRPCW
jgi:hypothetical protein